MIIFKELLKSLFGEKKSLQQNNTLIIFYFKDRPLKAFKES